jgi:hypothetical protein
VARQTKAQQNGHRHDQGGWRPMKLADKST